MQLRRPLAALLTALALFGGGATMTACEAAGQDQNDGTTDSEETAPNTETDDESDPSQDNPPDISDESGGAGEDQDDDSQDPD
jgi:hypothetical protein